MLPVTRNSGTECFAETYYVTNMNGIDLKKIGLSRSVKATSPVAGGMVYFALIWSLCFALCLLLVMQETVVLFWFVVHMTFFGIGSWRDEGLKITSVLHIFKT